MTKNFPRKYKKRGLKIRFHMKWDLNEQTGCWIWNASKHREGYGHIGATGTGKLLSAHRVSYELHRGMIPEGYEVHHKCRRPDCVNPFHLEALPAEQHRRLHK